MGYEDTRIKDQQKPLSSMRIAITSVDLEQSEHRGIAHLSKSIIRSLSNQGAQVYLLTGFYGRRLSPFMRFFMNDFSVNEVDSADILDQLSDPICHDDLKETDEEDDFNIFEEFLKSINSVKMRINKILYLLKPILKFYLRRAIFSGKIIRLIDLRTSPYWGQERIDYLQYVDGFLSVPDIFLLTTLRSRGVLLNSPKINLKKHNIDFLITTCPLSLKIKSRQKKSHKILQFIMDFIPLSFYKHPDHPYSFYNRLQDSMKSKCCFISQSSRDKICTLLDKEVHQYKDDIIYPLPSLNIETLNIANNLKSIRGIDSKFILFNSSIVPRKNLHFLIQAFQSSIMPSQGVKLCVAGKIHNDSYSVRIKNICDKDSSIELLGYVDEIEKSWLFLNAHAFASPSCVEGFGIPVLDAYILGLNVLASDIPSHQEIANIPNAAGKLNLLELTNINSWISSLNEILEEDKITSFSKNQRIAKFTESEKRLRMLFDAKLFALITQ